MRLDIRRPLNVCRASAGTGKTYTLAAYYIGLLLSGEDYRSILAVTFTNKATAEMKERILTYLHGIAKGDAEQVGFLAAARDFMIPTAACAHPELQTDEQLRERAQRCFEEMLLDFDGVQVQTIDSFLQTLLSGMASMLSMAAGLQTELDVDRLIRQSVDELLTTDATPESTRRLRAIVGARLEDDRSWDVRDGLVRLASELYNEHVQMLDAQGQIVFDAERIARYRQALVGQWKQHAVRLRVERMLEPMRGQTYKERTNGGDIDGFVANVSASLDDPESLDADKLFRGLTDKQQDKLAAGKYDGFGEAAEAMRQIQALLPELKTYYLTMQLTLQLTDEMQLMADLQQRINENLLEQNCALLARTANTLVQALKPGDADFVLEKAGIRYRHVLMDEFQDTSRLQWQVFEQLVRDVLAGEGHTLLIVGDIKQSIYRWRNGDWRIMADLGRDRAHFADQYNTDFKPLSRNFRSRREVVQFNLSTMQRVVDRLCESRPMDENMQQLVRGIYDEGFDGDNLDLYYNPAKSGGYVRLCSFNYMKAARGEQKEPVSELIMADMFEQMEQLLQAGVQPDSIMILVRRKSEALQLTQAYEQLSETEYPCLRATRMVSSDSFLLESSPSVMLLVHALRYRHLRDDVSAYYVRSVAGDESLTGIDALSEQLPLYELVSELIALLLCDQDTHFTAEDQAYVHCLCDQVRAYVASYGSSVGDFLQYWDDHLHAQAIPVPASDAITIMTIHASKGLQAGTIFLPFCDWPLEAPARQKPILWCPAEVQPDDEELQMRYMPIQDGSKMALSDYAPYHEVEQLHYCIDALNMLYVALTRAESNLYVYTHTDYSTKRVPTGQHVGSLLLTDEPDVDEPVQIYESGVPYTMRKTASESSSVFAFGAAPEQPSDIYCDSGQVRFCQSRDALMYLERGEAERERIQSRIDLGNLCHDIFAHMRTASDAEGIIHDYYTRGLIETAEQRDEVARLIAGAWESEQMRHWFTDPWTLQLEAPIYMGDCELRPDRVMTDAATGRAIVLDYKFGGHNDHYHEQVRQYMQAMHALGYQHVEGYLWYARERKLEEVRL